MSAPHFDVSMVHHTNDKIPIGIPQDTALFHRIYIPPSS
jgi:hypothetical protein